MSYVQLTTDNADQKTPTVHARTKNTQFCREPEANIDKFFDDLPQVSQHLHDYAFRHRRSHPPGHQDGGIRFEGLTDKLTMNPSQIISSPSREGVKIPK